MLFILALIALPCRGSVPFAFDYLVMADEDQNVRMPMGDRGHAAGRGSNEEDDEMRGAENDDMDDLREDESYEEESDDNDDGGDEDEDESDDDEEEEEEVDNEIVDKFTRTFHNGDYDAEFDDALSYDRSVTIPNQATQAAYNKPDNWREKDSNWTGESEETVADLYRFGDAWQ